MQTKVKSLKSSLGTKTMVFLPKNWTVIMAENRSVRNLTGIAVVVVVKVRVRNYEQHVLGQKRLHVLTAGKPGRSMDVGVLGKMNHRPALNEVEWQKSLQKNQEHTQPQPESKLSQADARKQVKFFPKSSQIAQVK